MVRRAGAALAAIALTGCSAAGATPLKRSPEPAQAPVTSAAEGRVSTLDVDDPEGVVTVGGLIVLAARRPGALLVLDDQLHVLRAVHPPGAARHLELAGDDVLYPGEDTDSLSVVDPRTGAVLSTTTVGDHPHDAAEVGDTLVSTDEGGYGLSFVRSGRTTGRVTGLDFPGGMAADGDRVAVVEVRGRVLTIVDVRRLQIVLKVAVGAGPTHAVALDHGLVAVADTSGNTVYVVQVQGTPHVVSRLAVAGKPYGLAFGNGTLWVATGADNLLHELPLRGTRLSAGRTWHTVQQPNSLAVIPTTGQVVVVGATNPGRVEVITP